MSWYVVLWSPNTKHCWKAKQESMKIIMQKRSNTKSVQMLRARWAVFAWMRLPCSLSMTSHAGGASVCAVPGAHRWELVACSSPWCGCHGGSWERWGLSWFALREKMIVRTKLQCHKLTWWYQPVFKAGREEIRKKDGSMGRLLTCVKKVELSSVMELN